MDEKRAKEVFADKAFVKSLLELETPEKVQAAVKGKGLDLSLEEIASIRKDFQKAAENGGKLSDEELENVAGGGVVELFTSVVELTTEISRSRW